LPVAVEVEELCLQQAGRESPADVLWTDSNDVEQVAPGWHALGTMALLNVPEVLETLE
jgi:hypothetical protein